MTEAERLAARISARLPQIESRSIRIWGQWVGGKAWDAWFDVIRCEAEGDMLQLEFAANEALSVWAPRRSVVDDAAFRIGDADRVRWEWYSYGQGPPLANCKVFEFRRTSAGIEWTREPGEWHRQLHPPPAGQPAIEFLSVADLRRSPE